MNPAVLRPLVSRPITLPLRFLPLEHGETTAMADSSGARECKRNSVAGDASSSPHSSSSSSSSKRRKLSSPLEGGGGGFPDSELAGCALFTGFAEEVKEEFRSSAASFLGELTRSSFAADLPALPAPHEVFYSGEAVEERFLVGDRLEKSLEMETSSCGSFREATPSSELCHDCEKNPKKMELQQFPAKKQGTQELAAGRNMPPLAEIEGFFSAAEKYEQRRFTEKYNYDFARDVSLQGRHPWVGLKP